MIYPTGLQLLEFFGVEPILYDDVSVYKICDDTGLELSLSFDTSDDSFQTSLRLMGRQVLTVCHEGMTRLWIEDKVFFAEALQDSYKISVIVKVCPYIDVRWSGMRM